MNLNIRGAVIHNIHKMDESELTHMIQDSIQKGDEKYLPGLGVLFEVIWNHSKPEDRKQMVQTLHHQMKQTKAPSPFL